jgi:hypothetical protein
LLFEIAKKGIIPYFRGMKNLSLFVIITFFLSINVSAQNLMVSYNMNGNLLDDSGNNNLIQSGTGNDVQFVDGISMSTNDSAAHFQQQKGLESIAAIDNSNWSGTAISIWIKDCVDTTALSNIFGGAYWGASIFADTKGKVNVFFDGSSSGALVSTSSLNDGTWHHIVSQNNGDKTELYVDGMLNGTIAETLFKLTSANSNAKIYLGTTHLQITKLDGMVDDIKVYDDTLSQVQITNLYNARLASVNEKSIVQKVAIYPNPANSSFSIQNLSKEAQSVTITDIRGRITQEASLTMENIDISALSSGTYFITISDKDKNAIGRGKLIKN